MRLNASPPDTGLAAAQHNTAARTVTMVGIEVRAADRARWRLGTPPPPPIGATSRCVHLPPETRCWMWNGTPDDGANLSRGAVMAEIGPWEARSLCGALIIVVANPASGW